MSTPDYPCPRCGIPLGFEAVEDRRQMVCPSCGGVAPTVAVLRQTSDRPAFQGFWRSVMTASGPGHLACPACSREMQEVQVQAGPETVTVDRCVPCGIVWFDPEERERLLGAARDRAAAAREARAAEIAQLPAEAQAAIAGLAVEGELRKVRSETIQTSAKALNTKVEPMWRRGRLDIHGALWLIEALPWG